MLYTVTMISKKTGIPRSTISRWALDGFLTPVHRAGRQKRMLFPDRVFRQIEAHRARAEKRDRPISNSTLCWSCINTYGKKCSWAYLKKPVCGWQAKEVHLKAYDEPTYLVLKCPLYEKEQFYTDRHGIRRRVNTVPEMQSRNGIDILDFFKKSIF